MKYTLLLLILLLPTARANVVESIMSYTLIEKAIVGGGALLINATVDIVEDIDERINNDDDKYPTPTKEGNLGYQYYLIANKHCVSNDIIQADKWFLKAKQQGYTQERAAEDDVTNKCNNTK
jgi:hypothetical protein